MRDTIAIFLQSVNCHRFESVNYTFVRCVRFVNKFNDAPVNKFWKYRYISDVHTYNYLLYIQPIAITSWWTLSCDNYVHHTHRNTSCLQSIAEDNRTSYLYSNWIQKINTKAINTIRLHVQSHIQIIYWILGEYNNFHYCC